MNKNLIDDIVYFLEKDTLKSYQSAQILINAEVERKFLLEHGIDVGEMPSEDIKKHIEISKEHFFRSND